MKKKIFILITLLVLFTTGCSTKKDYLEEITYQDYKSLIENNETFAFELMSDDCSHCKDLKPKLDKVLEEYNITLKYINKSNLSDDDKKSLEKDLGSLATPTIFFYNEGKELSTKTRIVGDVSKDKLIDKFKENGYID